LEDKLDFSQSNGRGASLSERAMGLCLEQAYKRKYGGNCGTKATG
jgi:hypothetical protein